MCTTGAINLNGFILFKTRDPVAGMIFADEVRIVRDKIKKLIVSNNDGMYGGINDLGVGIVATYVKVRAGQIPYLVDDYIEQILEAKTAKEATKIIESFNPPIGGNIIVADENSSFVIECGPDELIAKEVKDKVIRTNHFLNLPYQSIFYKDSKFKKWTETRFSRATKLLRNVKNIKDIKSLLKDHEGYPDISICNHGKIPTGSAFIINTEKREILHCEGNPCESKFKKYNF